MSAQGSGNPPKKTDATPTVELKAVPDAEQAPARPPADIEIGADDTRPMQRPVLPAQAPEAAAAAPAAGPSKEDLGLAGKLQEVMKAKTFDKGSEASVVKLADIIKIVRDMLGASTGKSEAQLQDEIVRLKLQLNNLTAQAEQRIAAERSRAEAAEAELRNLKSEVERLRIENVRLKAESEGLKEEMAALKAEIEKLKAEIERLKAELAKSDEARRAAEEQAARVTALLGASPTIDELEKQRDELVKLVAELEDRARSQRSDVRYAQLIEDPAFPEEAATAAEVETQAAKAPEKVAEAAREAATLAAAASKADGPAFKKLVEEVHAKRGTTHTVARLEVLSGVHNALRSELDRWRRATAAKE